MTTAFWAFREIEAETMDDDEGRGGIMVVVVMMSMLWLASSPSLASARPKGLPK